MLPLWVTYTLISGILSVAFNFISRKVLRGESDSTSYSWWFELFRFIIFIPFAFPFLPLLQSSHNLTLFLLIGISEFLAIYFYMKMHANTDLSISSVVTQMRLVLVPVFAFLFLSEQLKIKSYFAIIIILLGQIIVSLNGNKDKKLFLNNGVKYALIATIFISLNNVFAKPAASTFPVQLIPVAMAFPSIFLFPYFMKNGKERIIKAGKSMGKKILIAAAFNAVAMVYLILALRFGQVGEVTSLYQSMSVIQVFSGIVFLNERKDIGRKVLGSAIVLLGVYYLL